MNKILILKLVFVFSFVFSNTYAQTDWVEYLVQKKKGLLSVSVNLDFIDERPNYKNLLIVAINYKDCLKNGFPKQKGTNKLYAFSDSTEVIINKLTKHTLVGIITYQCMGFDIYYVKDTLNIRKNINRVINTSFTNSSNYIILRQDKNWNYYFKSLYPENVSDAYFADQKYLINLVVQGDELKGKRKIKHWAYFAKPKKREKFIRKIKPLEFSIDSLNFIKEKKYPYEVQFSRADFVSPSYIINLTRFFQVFIEQYKGVYEGWSTDLIIEEE